MRQVQERDAMGRSWESEAGEGGAASTKVGASLPTWEQEGHKVIDRGRRNYGLRVLDSRVGVASPSEGRQTQRGLILGWRPDPSGGTDLPPRDVPETPPTKDGHIYPEAEPGDDDPLNPPFPPGEGPPDDPNHVYPENQPGDVEPGGG